MTTASLESSCGQHSTARRFPSAHDCRPPSSSSLPPYDAGAGVEAEQSKPTRWKNIFSKRIFFREGPLFNAKRIEDGTDTGRFLAVEAKNEFIVDLVKTKRENIAGEMVDVNFLKVDTPNGTGWVFDRHPHTAEVIVQKLE